MNEHIEEGKIALLAGGDLEAGRTAAVASHLSRCASCSAVLESYRQSRQAIAALRDFGVHAGEFADFRQSVLERLPVRRPHLRFFTWPHLTPLQGGVLATLLLAAATAGTYAWKMAHHQQSAEPHAQVKIFPKAAIRPSTGARADLDARSAPAQRMAQNPDRQLRRRQQRVAINAPLPSARAHFDPQTQANQPAVPDDVAMKLETSDPNVIIIWLASPKGAGR